MPVQVRYFAGARAAAGVEVEQVEATRIDDLVAQLGAARGERLAKVLASCSFLVNGIAARDLAAPLPMNAEIDVLPPFAGG